MRPCSTSDPSRSRPGSGPLRRARTGSACHDIVAGGSMRPLSVVVFGGTGFIGSHLMARLSRHGVPVLLPTRHEQHGDHLKLLPEVDVVEARLGDDAALQRLVAGRTAV